MRRPASLMILILLLSFSVLPAHTQAPDLASVERWFYFLDVNLHEETIAAIEASTYDLVVIDYIPSEAQNTDFPMAETVARWQNAAHPKLVIAYIDIGQAERFRTYWQDGWQVGDPAWIAGDDPDGWVENYPVAYWWDDWQAIWLGEGGYLQGILDAGFDGIYLDWVEAYSDDSVRAIAAQDRVDPAQEMLWWVEDMAAFTRAQDAGFYVIAQNAAELAYEDGYLNTIDAIAQEQVWFDGAADNAPAGDCPLPRTEAEVETAAYVAALSAACRNLYETYPDSTLHVSSESYLTDLLYAQSQGTVIFTVDYALEAANIEWVVATSRGYGFIPFVSNRALNQYIDPIP